ncbi:unnamed protein product [Zymoseptoria tritici ST99CH_3D1]|nr:unnamed protein product [Zymoseptoria tritici ST99CH_1E4]SMR47667.1 unnamed protein product [Zymoseptoria tritici ST99CH_3D1]
MGGYDAAGTGETRRQNHPYSTRNGSSFQESHSNARLHNGNAQRSLRGSTGAAAMSGYARGSPVKKDQKHVVFQLIDPEDPRIQARLPMRVMISPHDTTESIITTVKNFYGVYEYGVSFENRDGISIIAAYENFDNDMTVYVRAVAQPLPPLNEHVKDAGSPKRLALGAPFEMRPPSHSAAQSPSRSAARSAGVRSLSPHSDIGRRSASAAPGNKARLQKSKSKENSVAGEHDGYSSDINDNGSVASSRRSKAEEIKAEITVDNIVEGGRRKRAFESSELPLFVPPQVPMSTSISSISPQRRAGPPNVSPYGYNGQQTFAYPQPLPSPQSYGYGSGPSNGFALPSFPSNPYQNGYQPASRQLRGSRVSHHSHRNSIGGILPTPDPTIGSVISDEDVALQLMRLGDPTAFSHGRTSTSTVDDALSGKAEAASSDEEDEDDGDEDEEGDSMLPAVPRSEKPGPQRKKQRTANELPSDATSYEDYEDRRDATFRGDSDVAHREDGHRHMGKPKHKARNGSGPTGTANKSSKPRASSISKSKKPSVGHNHAKVPMSPASLPSQSRKASVSSSTINFQHQLGVDEEDLSSKPRCQRCRKSKKGCDRQRPCGRCKDAGIGADGCLSEDEGNGRKGRYGRHMGVTIKKGEGSVDEEDSPQPSMSQHSVAMPANGYFLAPALPDKSKKRKR